MPMILLIIVAATLLLVAGIIIIILRRGFGPFKTKEGHLMGPHELLPVVIEQLESFLHEQSDKLMAPFLASKLMPNNSSSWAISLSKSAFMVLGLDSSLS